MELWVRSQKKLSLIKVNAVNILEFEGCIAIHGYINHDTHFWLANYKTKERALEIIDEIQNILIMKNSFSLNDEIMTKSLKKNTEEEIREVIKQISVYQMPEE